MTGSVPQPAPLVPAEVDLRDFAFMPLDVQRLRDSDLASDETPEACWAAVLLWCASWHQVPAASIPDSDSWQAKHAGYVSRGRIDPQWPKIKEGALRGWVLCNDGRLYHPVVAEKARDAWDSKLEQRWKSEIGRIKKHNQRHGMSLPCPSFEVWMKSGCPQGQTLPVPEDNQNCPRGQNPYVPEDNGGMSTGTGGVRPQDVPGDKGSKGQGQGQGQGKDKSSDPSGLVPGSAGDPPGQKVLPGQETEAEARERRLNEVVRDAVETYNAALFTKSRGGNCPNIQPSNLKARDWVKRAIDQVRAICQQAYGSKVITRQFWIDYWATVDADPFSSGRSTPSEEHPNWVPDFEFLTRPARIAKLFDKAMSEPSA